jgi:UDP-N-acetylmuramoylalanine--D-glutamate ligase
MGGFLQMKGKRVLVVGLGRSGVASALFLKELGAQVTVSDTKTQEELASEIPALLDRGIIVEAGRHGERTFREVDLIVVSPGVPVDVPQLTQARERGIPVIGEIELAARFLRGKIVAITGSNGKTTTTALSAQVVAAGGAAVQVGGNIGTPAISLAPTSTDDTWNVLEISSFQLETVETFRPKIAVVLNVTPDHLDRHRNFDGYVAAKVRIFEKQDGSDYAVLNREDPTCECMAAMTRARVYWFSRLREVEAGAFVRDGKIYWRDQNDAQEIMPVSEIGLKGAHNVENVLAAVCVGRLAGAAPAAIRQAVRAFQAVEHRLEFVATINGVEYYNDSKATNVDATIKALESFSGHLHVILGGKHKGSPYTPLRSLLEQRAKRVYTIGAAAEIIENDLRGAVEIVRAGTLESAIRRAAESAVAGDIVLLAPACASFDQFQGYEQRGGVFKEAVRALAKRQGAPIGTE